MEILRTKSQSAAVVIGIPKFFDEKENRDVIVTASDFKRNNAFIFKDSGNYFLGLENIFRNSLDELKDILVLAGGSTSKSKITQAGLSHMITFLEKLCLSDDVGVNKALSFIVFQIHDSSQRKGGVCTLFDILYNYLVQRGLNQESGFLSYGLYKEKKYIYINGKTVTYVCKNVDALAIKELANSKSHMTYADTIGSFRKSASGMDAVTFLTIKMDAMHTASIFGKTYNIGQLYYRQLNVEVNTLKKVLANINDHSRVKMHGNSRDGFVKRLDDAGKSRATGLIRALDHSNSMRFKSLGTGRDEKLSYVVDSCFIKKMQNGRGLCVTIDNINRLIEHKLVHDCGIGRSCICGAKACDDESLLNQLEERGYDVVANAKEALSAMSDEGEQKPTSVLTNTDAKLDDRILQNKGSRYMSASVYRSRHNPESSAAASVQKLRFEEVKGDLFDAPASYSMAHCVAEDLRMSAGIAVEFKNRFKNVDALAGQNVKTGDVAILEQGGRFIYYLVTKRFSDDKPTIETLRQALQKLADHVKRNDVKYIAMPMIGCGLDRLKWNEVSDLIRHVFSDIDVCIRIYEKDSANTSTDAGMKHTNNGIDGFVKGKEDDGVMVNDSTTFKINTNVVFDAADSIVADTSSGLSSLLKTKMKF
nr:VP5 [Banna virus]WPS64305.1 VP5 [Banna virus]